MPDPNSFTLLKQIHDFNPGIAQSGLFWTTVVDRSAVSVGLGAGTAVFEARNLPQKDFFDIQNAILGNGASPRQGHVSFRVEWSCSNPVPLDVPSQHYRGMVQDGTARMEWSGRSGDFDFQSGPLASSESVFAQIGSERNGSFY